MRTPKPILSIKAVVATALLRESLQSWLVTGLDHRIKSLEVYISALTEKINERKVLIYEKEEHLLGMSKQLTAIISDWDTETQHMIEELHQARDCNVRSSFCFKHSDGKN